MEKDRKRLSGKIRKNTERTLFFRAIMIKHGEIYQNNVLKTKNKDKNVKKVLHIF